MFPFSNADSFPPLHEADEDGLLAIGGDLSVSLLLEAYSKGIFPWYNEGEPIQWFSPDPRCVLFPDELRISKSMQQLLRCNKFSFTVNTAFKQVIESCSSVSRKDQDGTWIHNDMIVAYKKLNKLGFAHSAECWQDGELVGGLYGIKLGKVFFGESMFSLVANASKFAFIQYVQLLLKESVLLIDCQVKTDHLISLGARSISRNSFSKYITDKEIRNERFF